MKFSIIIPVYNAEKYLRPCLDSVLVQTERDWECICIDDGSTDGSATILDEYAERDTRFVVVHQENGGEGCARNTGLDIAHGEWITWLDADDVFVVDRLEEARRLIEKESPDLVRFRTLFEDEKGFGSAPREYGSRDYSAYSGIEAKEWGWNSLMPAGMVWTWVARRELVKGILFRQGMRVKVDCIYSGWIAGRLDKVIQSEYRAYVYRQLENSAIHSVRKSEDCLRFLAAAEDLWSKVITQYQDGRLKEVAKSRLRMCCQCDVIDWVRMRDKNDRRAGEIYEAYKRLLYAGAFDCKSIQQFRYRIAMLLWEKTGQMWPIKAVTMMESIVRRLRR